MLARLRRWLPVALALAGCALLGLPRSAHADMIPSLEVTIVVTDTATGNVVAGGTFDSGVHTGPPGQTPPFSANSTLIKTAFTSLGGISATGGQHTADNNYPAVTPGALGLNQYLESFVTNVTNTSGAARTVYLVVSGTGFQSATGLADTLETMSTSGTFSNGAGSNLIARWYADPGNHVSTVTGTAGGAPVFNLNGTLLNTYTSPAAPDNGPFSVGSGLQTSNLTLGPGNFSMTLFTQENLTPGAVLSTRTQNLEAGPGVPEPGTLTMAGCLLSVAAVGAWRRRRRKSD